jgi:hypothetical protein
MPTNAYPGRMLEIAGFCSACTVCHDIVSNFMARINFYGFVEKLPFPQEMKV